MYTINISGALSVAAICYLFAEMIKIIFNKSEKIKALLPIIIAFLGGLIGVAIFKLAPEIMNASNLVEAFVTGIFSGLSSTGSNQIYKQLKNLITKNEK